MPLPTVGSYFTNLRDRILICTCLMAVAAVPAGASEPRATEKKAGPPATHTVQRGSIRSKVQLDAVLQATEMHPIKVQTKAVLDLPVLDAVAHGVRVKKGDTLVRFDLEKLLDQIEDLEKERPGAVLALELAQAELDNLTQTTPLKLESSKRAQRIANEDLAYFEKVGKGARQKSVEFNLKNADQRMENANEELNQLKKMYDADDLTEETEEIILKRQKFAVESAAYYLETSRQSAELALKTTLPREHETLKAARRDQDLAAALAQETLERNLNKKRLDVEKMKRDQKKSEKRLAELKKDLEEMTVLSPASGFVYYGACEDGKWPTGSALAKRLVSGGKLASKEIFMTVVNPEKLVLRTTVPEAELSKLKVGAEGKASPVSASDRKMPVVLQELGEVPLPGGGFEAQLSFEKIDGLRLMPGMNCKVSFEGTRKTDVVVVPKDMVFGEGDQKIVYLASSGGHEKRTVKTGESDDRSIEIEEGLSAGDRILVKKPE